MRIIDRTRQALGRTIAGTRNINNIRRIAIHHSATTTGNTAIFENYWRNLPLMGAPNAVGGYHEVILLNGDLEINYLPTQISHGVGGQNADTYHICAVGNFRVGGIQPNATQMQVLLQRISFNVNRFANVTFDRVLGHNEFSGHATNSCPGMNMNHIRQQAHQFEQPSHSPEPTPPISSETFVVTSRTGGFNTAADAQANRNRRTWVDPDTYYVFNRSNGMVNVTRSRGIAGSWINPTGQSNKSETFAVTNRTGGFNTAADAQANRNRRTWVDPDTYHVFNRANGMVNVTHTKGVPGSWINPSGQGSTTSSNVIRVGSSVRVNNTAQRWITGELIPSWGRGQTYTVMQLRNGNREVLLAGVLSWIRVSDVTLL